MPKIQNGIVQENTKTIENEYGPFHQRSKTIDPISTQQRYSESNRHGNHAKYRPRNEHWHLRPT